MTNHRRNLELKVRCADADLDVLRQRLERLTCAPMEHLHQVDTYLRVEHGRLKVREITPGSGRPPTAELIAYARPSADGSRWSSYEVVPIAVSNVPALLRALALTHEVAARVEKTRIVGVIGHTRVHLDRVESLGAYVELETVVAGQSDADAAAEHDAVIRTLGLERFPSVSGSYGELVPSAGDRARR